MVVDTQVSELYRSGQACPGVKTFMCSLLGTHGLTQRLGIKA